MFHCVNTLLLFIHSSVDRHLYGFCFLAIKYNDGIGHLCKSFCVDIYFKSLGLLPSIDTAEWNCDSVFNVFRNSQIAFKSASYFCLPTGSSEYSNSSHPHQHYCLFVFILVILIKWHHIIALISIFFMTAYIKHVFMCSWTFAYFLWRNVYANILHIFNWAAFSNEF